MSMFKTMDHHLRPAYGRDYKSRAEVLADWHGGKDFVHATLGQYCSVRDMKDLPGQIWVRYAGLRKITRVQ